MGSPLFVLMPEIYFEGFFAEAKILLDTNDVQWNQKKWVWLIVRIWEASPVFLLLSLGAILYAFKKRDNFDFLFLSITILSFVVLGGLDKRTLQYFLFLFPFFAIQIARLINAIWQSHEKRKFVWSFKAMQVFSIGLIFILFTFSILFFKRLNTHAQLDNRILAKQWIEKNIPPTKTIIMNRFYLPPLKNLDFLIQKIWKNIHPPYIPYIEEYYNKVPHYFLVYISDIPCDIKSYEGISKTDYLILSSWNFDLFYDESNTSNQSAILFDPEKIVEKKCFYKNIFNNKYPFRLLKTINEGGGPDIYIFHNINKL